MLENYHPVTTRFRDCEVLSPVRRVWLAGAQPFTLHSPELNYSGWADSASSNNG